MMRVVVSAVIATLFAFVPAAWASGGPENLLIVVNDESPESLDIAHYYRLKRDIPAVCFCHLRLKPVFELPRDEFDAKILTPVLAHIKKAGLEGHTRYIVFTKGLPYRVGWGSPLRYTSVTTPAAAGGMDIGPFRAHPYFKSTRPFRPSEKMPYLSICLTGYTVNEVKRCIDQGVASDGTRPKGTIYMFDGVGPRARVAPRYGRDVAVEKLKEMGIAVEVRPGHSLKDEQDVFGYWTGLARVNTKNIHFLPGALADHLTSFGGILFNNKSQMSILDFIRAGASGSYGTVTEPTNVHTRHSKGWLFVRYAMGLSLIEAYWTSVQDVQIGVFVGEPLATPFATKPTVELKGPNPKKNVTGTVTFLATARPHEDGKKLKKLSWWLDGRPFGSAYSPSLPARTTVKLTVKERPVTATYDEARGLPGLLADLVVAVKSDAELSKDTGVEARIRGDGLEISARTEGADANGISWAVHMEGDTQGMALVDVFPCEGTLEGGAETKITTAGLAITVTGSTLKEGDSLTIASQGKTYSATVTTEDLASEKPLVSLLKKILLALRSTDIFGEVKAGADPKGRRVTIIFRAAEAAEAGNGQKVTITLAKGKGSKLSAFPRGEQVLSGGGTHRHFARAEVQFAVVFGALDKKEISFDTKEIGDGWHELRLVAVEAGPWGIQGHAKACFKVANGGGRLKLTPPRKADLKKPLVFRARFYGNYPAGLGRMLLLLDGREIAQFDRRKKKCTWDPANNPLGEGRHRFQVRVLPKKDTGRPITSDPVYLTLKR
jgi:uncharacterized protein (TIGR03790 family)